MRLKKSKKSNGETRKTTGDSVTSYKDDDTVKFFCLYNIVQREKWRET